MMSNFWATVFLTWNPYLQFPWSHNMDNLTSEKNKTEKTFTMQGVLIRKVTAYGATVVVLLRDSKGVMKKLKFSL